MSSIFPPGKEISVNFNWIDIVSGSGYITFYGTGVNLAAGETYNLVQSSISAASTNVADLGSFLSKRIGTGKFGAFQKVGDVDFDLSAATTPIAVEGKLMVCVPYFILPEDHNSNVGITKIIAKLRKWDGATETEIASATSADVSWSRLTHGLEISNNVTLFIEVPLTNYKKGETIRLTIEYWGADTSGYTFSMENAFNPDNTATGYFADGESRMSASIPFVVKL